ERRRAVARDDRGHGGTRTEPRAGRDRELWPLDPTRTARGDQRRDAALPRPPRSLVVTLRLDRTSGREAVVQPVEGQWGVPEERVELFTREVGRVLEELFDRVRERRVGMREVARPHQMVDPDLRRGRRRERVLGIGGDDALPREV